MKGATETITLGGGEASVFLPASYRGDAARRFPLLLLLTSGLEAQEAIAELHGEGLLPEMIVAEINPGSTIPDLAGATSALAANFRILDQPAARWIGGTGHDAVRALRGILDHPEIFGVAVCLSSSFEGEEGAPPPHSPMLLHLEKRSVPSRGNGGVRIYFDYGTLGLDECYEPYHRDLAAILRKWGWRDGGEFTIARHPGGSQTLSSWQTRMNSALRWLAYR